MQTVEAPRIPSDVFVEVTRVLIVALGTALGATAGAGGAALGACTGYVVGGVLGRWLRRAAGRFEEAVDRTPAVTVVAGAVGALVAAATGAIVGIVAVVLLPGRWGYPVLGLLSWVGVYVGFQIGARKGAELLRLVRVLPAPPAESTVLVGTSAAMDDRLRAVARAGFAPGALAVPVFVLDELRGLADAPEPTRRRRAQRALETLDALDVTVLADEVPHAEGVDEKLTVLADRLDATVLAACDLDRLAAGLRTELVPGERVELRLSRHGREPGQGVGFLEDGTMVVVSDGGSRVGDDVEVEVTTSVPTSKGRLYFAVLTG